MGFAQTERSPTLVRRRKHSPRTVDAGRIRQRIAGPKASALHNTKPDTSMSGRLVVKLWGSWCLGLGAIARCGWHGVARHAKGDLFGERGLQLGVVDALDLVRDLHQPMQVRQPARVEL